MTAAAKNASVLCAALTPCLQRILRADGFRPGGVNRAHAASLTVGGKPVNAARVLSALGASPVLTGLAGGANGARILSILDGMGIAHDFVRGERESRACTTIIDGRRGAATEIVEEGPAPSPREAAALRRKFSALLRPSALALVAGALPPGCPTGVYSELARAAARAGVPLLLDANGPALLAALPHRPLLAKSNREELARTLGLPRLARAQTAPALRALLARGARWALVTDGPHQALLAGEGGVWRYGPPRVKTVNGAGAGDSCTAGIAFALLDGKTMPEAVRFGMACGAANATTPDPGGIRVRYARRLLRRVQMRRAGRHASPGDPS